MSTYEFLATCPAGVGVYLAEELAALGATDIVERPVGVAFSGGLGLAYRSCLWSRLANRVILQLAVLEVDDSDSLYRAVSSVDWRVHMSAKATLLVDFTGRASWMRNAQFGAQRVKDAIVDQFRNAGLGRPSVDQKRPDIRVVARLAKGRLTLGIDLSGESLHRRGYRLDGGLAPLKENIAAAALWAANWPVRSQNGESLLDPMCGSATLLLEGALMALDRAPGLGRERFGFEQWAGHDPQQWSAVMGEAEARARAYDRVIEIRGYDADMGAVRRAQDNIARLGLESIVRIRCKSLADVKKPTHTPMPAGLVVMNPPWGERMGDSESLPHLYSAIGEMISREFAGWHGVVLTSEIELGKAVGLQATKRHRFQNGPLELHCLQFALSADNRYRSLTPTTTVATDRNQDSPKLLSDGAKSLVNRLQKNLRRLKSWLARENITCYRVYDADIPEYSVAIDCYEGRVHVAEYAAPAEIPAAKTAERLEAVLDAVQSVFDITDRSAIAVKRRKRQKGKAQYQRLGDARERVVVKEGAVKALVNLYDYLDTGLFLDHRPLRNWLGRETKGGHFLNLFSYTGVATLHAAIGGAKTSTSVDSSATYLKWFKANLALNGLSERQHRCERADVRAWLAADTRFYDTIMLDPPSFSNSSDQADFDIQADHKSLLQLAMARLSERGVLYFSTNRRRFKLDEEVARLWSVADMTRESTPLDFSRPSPIHLCWRLTHR
ncbi:MAG: bifunctional 23S rRNA (guanine(2069)-N(7))-methyltransferase RlmK/23S rRNA (guanine(2445)-N(2))-methyltransferase RlmL [Luminiphilus sp.]|nr:bifunctional 23S rRNA (guanine(2069)-N(7))-methyltransferase RlmK/23S rRNA (guanine(2445)-N(2))-methyltransferase RlmL [Luminiphilus sp.]